MPDQTVQVTFDPADATSWNFEKNPAVMTAAGKVILTRFPANQTWKFKTATGLPPGYTVTVTGNGQMLEIDDPFTPLNTPLSYSVIVTSDGMDYSSPMQLAKQGAKRKPMDAGPPPIIMNDGTLKSAAPTR